MDREELLRKKILIDDADVFEKLVDMSAAYVRVDNQGNILFMVPPGKLTDRQAIALTLLGRYFAAELKCVSSDFMTADEVRKYVDADKKVISARLNDLKTEGIVESPERGNFRIVWLKVDKILKELGGKENNVDSG